MRSVSSVLAVSTNRSAKQFALGQRGGIFTVCAVRRRTPRSCRGCAENGQGGTRSRRLAPLKQPDGTLTARHRGTPQGSAVSPVLANLFMHYAFDT
jgi:hypothetical protein